MFQICVRHMLLLCIIFMYNISRVHSDCATSVQEMPETVTVDEITSGAVLFNITSDRNVNWTCTFEMMDGAPLTPIEVTQLRKFFEIIQTPTYYVWKQNDSLVLDKEYFFAYFTVTLVVQAVNEHNPVFKSNHYDITIKEDTKIQTVLLSLMDEVEDDDRPIDGGYSFQVLTSNNSQLDGSNNFGVEVQAGRFYLKKQVDFDAKKSLFWVVVQVKDRDGKSALTTVRVTVTDVDDLPPKFDFNCLNNCATFSYSTQTSENYRGVLHILPKPIIAHDQDSLGYSVVYSILKAADGYQESFVIDPQTAVVTQTNDVTETNILTIKATEMSNNSFSATTTLLVRVGNESLVETPTAKSEVTEDSTMFNAVIAIAVVFVLVTIFFIVFLILYRRKVHRMLISPQDSERTPGDGKAPSADELETKSNNSKELLLNPNMLVRSDKLPPLEKKDTGIGTESSKKRSRRRRKNKEEEIFDGTKQYDMEVPDEYLDAKDKTKIKQSTRSKDTKTDPKYWITVPNEEDL